MTFYLISCVCFFLPQSVAAFLYTFASVSRQLADIAKTSGSEVRKYTTRTPEATYTRLVDQSKRVLIGTQDTNTQTANQR